MPTKRGKRPILTQEQIDYAKYLKENTPTTKRKLARLFGVGETTIWENVFTDKKRVRIRIPRPIDNRPHCTGCEVKMSRDLPLIHPLHKKRYVPANFQIGDKCITCFLEALGLNYSDITT